jgi:hypothetical protein
MKKIFLSICLLSFVSFSISAFDWGGILNNNTQGNKTESFGASITQSNALYLWTLSEITDTDLMFSSEIMYEYKYNRAKYYSSFENIFDVDLLRLNGSLYLTKGILDFSIGRFFVSDVTNSIFSQTSDGLLLKYGVKNTDFSFYTGYTGLLNAHNVSILNVDGTTDAIEKDFYSLCKPYIPITVAVVFKQLFLQQSVSLAANTFIDASKNNDNRFYATITFDGPLSQGIYYDWATTFAAYNFEEVSNYSKLKFHIFITESLYTSIGLEYASGNNGGFEAFRTFTSKPIVSAAETIETSGIILPAITLSRNLDNIYTSFDAKLLLDCANSSVSVWGPEVVASVVYNAFYDLQFCLDASAFWDIKGKGKLTNYSATLKVNVVF